MLLCIAIWLLYLFFLRWLGSNEAMRLRTSRYRGGNNFIRFQFRHLAIFPRFNTKTLKLLVVSPKLPTTLLF